MKKISIYAAAVLLGLGACTKDLTVFNDNPKLPIEVPAEALFANATKELSDYLSSPNVNVNTFRLWSQQWTQTTYTDESNYELTERNINGEVWDIMYTRVLRDCKESRHFIEIDARLTDDEKNLKYAMITVIESYAYSILLDIFGDIPYSEALKGLDELTPAYDDAETVYKDVISNLTAASATLESSSADVGTFGSADILYGGGKPSWAAFANSLVLRMAVRFADYDPSFAKTTAESVLNKSLITDNGMNAEYVYASTTPNTNPMWEDLVQSKRNDFIISNTIGDIMNDLSDPRKYVYFQNLDLDTLTGIDTIKGNEYGGGGAYTAFTQPGELQREEVFPGHLMTASEVHFLMADAAERGWSTSGSAAIHYTEAIKQSFEYWGLDTAEFNMYISNPDVNYLTAPGDWKQKIGTQKWLALYDQGLEAWSSWRLYDYPVMNVAVEAGTTPPTRFNYTVDEYSVNGPNVATANGGNDGVFDKVFWDVN